MFYVFTTVFTTVFTNMYVLTKLILCWYGLLYVCWFWMSLRRRNGVSQSVVLCWEVWWKLGTDLIYYYVIHTFCVARIWYASPNSFLMNSSLYTLSTNVQPNIEDFSERKSEREAGSSRKKSLMYIIRCSRYMVRVNFDILRLCCYQILHSPFIISLDHCFVCFVIFTR